MKRYLRAICVGLLLFMAACAASAMSIREAKQLPDTLPVSLTGKVVTYANSGFFYIQEDSGYMGIRVEQSGHNLAAGMRADVDGCMATDEITNERYILATTAVQTAPPNETGTVAPVMMTGAALGGGDWSIAGTGGQKGVTNGKGLNNIGLLVKVCGQFNQTGEATFTLSDGAGTVLCQAPEGTFLWSVWHSVVVTGVSSMCFVDGEYKPLLLVRDIRAVTADEAVSTPGTPRGEAAALKDLEYGYTTSGAICSHGHAVEYRFDWGDGTSSAWSTARSATHTWSSTGTKTITVSARCQANPALQTTSEAFTVTVVTQLASAPWQMFRHDRGHSGQSPVHDAVQSGSVWSISVGNGLSSPAIGRDGTTYLSGSSNLTALNKDGTFKWSRAINSNTRSSPAIGADGTIYIGGNGLLYAITPAGAEKWTFPVTGDVSSSPVIGPDGTVYVGTRSGYLYAITPGSSSGTQKWSRSGLGAMHVTSPAISPDGSTLYVDGGNYLHARYTSNGNAKWSHNFGTSTTSSAALSPDGSTVYTGSGDGNLWSFNASTGAVNWQKPVGFKPAVTSASPAVGADGTIYLGSNYGSLYAINPDGSEKWIYEAKWDIRSSVAINADGTVILASHDGYIRGLDSATGAEKWHHLLPGNLYASPAIAPNGKIVIASMSGTVYGNVWGTPPTTTPPSDLSITMQSDTQVALTWQDNSPDEYGFRVERKKGATGLWVAMPNVIDPTTKLPTVGPGVTTYVDSGLLSGQTYYYRVCAFQSGSNSGYTNIATVVTPGVRAPDGLTAAPVSESQVDLSWTDMSDDELEFIIERSVGPNGLFEEIARVPANVTTYSDTRTYPARYYYYRVRGYNGAHESTYSNWACALTPGRDFSEIRRGDPSRNQLALTFDAGTAAVQTSLLDTLKSNKVFCNFFITGYVTEVQGSHISRIGRDGHMMGNHTYDHPDLRYILDSQIYDQFDVTEDIVYNASGHHTRPYFRAPYGARDQRVLNVTAANGYQHVYWTKDSRDSLGASTAEIIANATAGADNGAIILFHCTSPNTADAMPTVIANLQGMGFQLVTVPEIVAPQQVSSPEGFLQEGWNLISLPIEPALEFPHVVFRDVNIDGCLKRWDRKTASEMTYSAASPGSFGNVYADEGYWLYLPSGRATMKFNGAAATTDRRIRLQNATDPPGYGLIGYPFETPQSFANCSVYNPDAEEPKTRSVADAIAAGWIPSSFKGWDAATQTEYDVPLLTSMMEPWRGYRAGCLVPNVELLIPKPL